MNSTSLVPIKLKKKFSSDSASSNGICNEFVSRDSEKEISGGKQSRCGEFSSFFEGKPSSLGKKRRYVN